MSHVEECWFCGGPASERHVFRVGLHRDVKTSAPLVVVVRTEWTKTLVDVPRCGRCKAGHYLEVLLLLVGLPSLAWGLGMLADTALGNYNAQPMAPSTVFVIGVWFLPFVAWLALRQAWFGLRRWHPHNRRYVRRHPDVHSLLEDGWRYGRAPLSEWDRRIPTLD
jgi:hypothetical protein